MSLTDQFTQELIEAMPDPRSRVIVLSVLARWAGSSLYLPTPSKAARRSQSAANMLANGMTCADAANVLRQRFNVAQRTAERYVKRAGQLSRSNVVLEQEDVVSITNI
jgi:Mor family transcriptional regulator